MGRAFSCLQAPKIPDDCDERQIARQRTLSIPTTAPTRRQRSSPISPSSAERRTKRHRNTVRSHEYEKPRVQISPSSSTRKRKYRPRKRTKRSKRSKRHSSRKAKRNPAPTPKHHDNNLNVPGLFSNKSRSNSRTLTMSNISALSVLSPVESVISALSSAGFAGAHSSIDSALSDGDEDDISTSESSISVVTANNDTSASSSNEESIAANDDNDDSSDALHVAITGPRRPYIEAFSVGSPGGAVALPSEPWPQPYESDDDCEPDSIIYHDDAPDEMDDDDDETLEFDTKAGRSDETNEIVHEREDISSQHEVKSPHYFNHPHRSNNTCFSPLSCDTRHIRNNLSVASQLSDLSGLAALGGEEKMKITVTKAQDATDMAARGYTGDFLVVPSCSALSLKQDISCEDVESIISTTTSGEDYQVYGTDAVKIAKMLRSQNECSEDEYVD